MAPFFVFCSLSSSESGYGTGSVSLAQAVFMRRDLSPARKMRPIWIGVNDDMSVDGGEDRNLKRRRQIIAAQILLLSQ
jgi:hypothetical protein